MPRRNTWTETHLSTCRSTALPFPDSPIPLPWNDSDHSLPAIRFDEYQGSGPAERCHDSEPASRLTRLTYIARSNCLGRHRRRIPYFDSQPIDEELQNETARGSTLRRRRMFERVGNQFGRDKGSIISQFRRRPSQQHVDDVPPSPAGSTRGGGEMLCPRREKTRTADSRLLRNLRRFRTPLRAASLRQRLRLRPHRCARHGDRRWIGQWGARHGTHPRYRPAPESDPTWR
ncbi:hypothetical protein Caci_6885 [Catenulispora acidiphila DSM 44928]|uniref:Uncharacterized protein n=1 Tax=Catenulispora acidiphila (strain DSM 44928 / JCM 14897 / NBRC 102108 / NRRL B-24433 / ID139908) TaxID=479433 RepID=C7Q3F8_CATAD|nr:hypothetical protein Caci_6885 [Catenulispora acidiphila DSM 44928]